MRQRFWLILIAVLALAACVREQARIERPVPGTLAANRLPDLPHAVTNNAVASVAVAERTLLFSFLGLGAGKTWRDTRSWAWLLEINHNQEPGPEMDAAWMRLRDVPGPGGRLAATAVTVAGKVYLFGGYTVAEDGSEKSVALVHRLDPDTLAYEDLSPMPVPVDDSVSLVYRDRYVYLVSGWHDTDNVDTVQVYDAKADSWSMASPFPGPPVFGHAGGISGDRMVICDGVKVVPVPGGKRRFEASPECFAGLIDDQDPTQISWHRISHHSHPALYRVAATGTEDGRVIFAGGSDNPYNYDGIGYDGRPSEPSGRVFYFDLDSEQWQSLGDLPQPSMDHRGLVPVRGGFALVGGMGTEQQVIRRVVVIVPD